MATIRNPIEWGTDEFERAAQHLRSIGRALHGSDAANLSGSPVVRKLEMSDLKDVLSRGLQDFGACRSDVLFLCLIYPAAGLLLAWFTFDYDLLPLLFPVASGFALLGPVAAVGLYEMSRRREDGSKASWADAFGVLRAPAFGAILVLGLVLLSCFLLWLAAAQVIYALTLGPESPASLGAFAHDVFTTGAGWSMISIGIAVGFLFALLVLSISIVSFPLLLDRDDGLSIAVRTSVRVVIRNPAVSAAWGLIVAGGLALGSIPLLLGLIIVMPVLGHATWHLYRKAVARR